MWVDLMKIGRVGQQELNNLVDLLGVALHSRPTASCAIIIAPFLISEKVSNGLRGEVQRLEDKLDCKKIVSTSISIRCGDRPATKKVPLVFPGWIAISEAGMEENVFRSCQLMADRTHVSSSHLRHSIELSTVKDIREGHPY